jgi:hypothetical protein
MRIAKLKTTPVQTTSQGILEHYYKVPDNHVFLETEDSMTSFDTLYVFCCGGMFDYGVFRDSIRDVLVPRWAELFYADRRKCVQHYRYPTNISQEEFDNYFSSAEHERNWAILTTKTRAVRLQRLFAAFQKISFRLPESQVAVIYIVTKQMCYDYYYANLPHIMLWLQNGQYPALGINYTANGFAQMAGYSTSLMYELLDIFVNGNYENVDHEMVVI